MTTEFSHALPRWSVGVPIAAVVALAIVWNRPLGSALIVVVALVLIAAVLAAVHHAEVVALRVGEPYGTLILAVAVTIIEVGLIVSVMLAGGPTATVVARDAVYAAVMITSTGIIGVCLLVGGLRHRELDYRVEGTSPALAVLAALAVLTLVVPAYTTTTPGPSFSTLQLAFAGVMSLVLYCVFVFVQTVRHRDYFLPADVGDRPRGPPPLKIALASFGLLAVSLIAVVGLAKSLAPSIEAGVAAASAPLAVVGIAIAMLVLLPETAAAVRAAARNRLQTSLNLGIGSAIACIGLTIPVVAVVSMMIGMPLELGIAPKETVLLVLTFLVAVLTLSSGRATIIQGAVHLVLFTAFIFLAFFP
jgi:Ca2+:H+ antiporter